MFEQLLEEMEKIEKDFELGHLLHSFWRRILFVEQDAVGIKFDIENDDSVGEKQLIDTGLKYENGDSLQVLCQLHDACGDWESPVGYFRCQSKDSFKGSFIHIPGPTVNKNLVKRDKNIYSPIGNGDKDQEKDTVKISTLEKDLWNDLKKELKVRLKPIVDDYDTDYKAIRLFIDFPKK